MWRVLDAVPHAIGNEQGGGCRNFGLAAARLGRGCARDRSSCGADQQCDKTQSHTSSDNHHLPTPSLVLTSLSPRCKVRPEIQRFPYRDSWLPRAMLARRKCAVMQVNAVMISDGRLHVVTPAAMRQDEPSRRTISLSRSIACSVG